MCRKKPICLFSLVLLLGLVADVSVVPFPKVFWDDDSGYLWSNPSNWGGDTLLRGVVGTTIDDISTDVNRPLVECDTLCKFCTFQSCTLRKFLVVFIDVDSISTNTLMENWRNGTEKT